MRTSSRIRCRIRPIGPIAERQDLRPDRSIFRTSDFAIAAGTFTIFGMSKTVSPSSSTVPAAHTAWLKRNAFWRFAHIVLTPFFVFWVRTHSIGTDRIDNTKGGLLLLNHESYLDPLVAAFPLRRPVSFLARDGLFRVPVLGWILRHTYVVPVNQTAFRGSTIRAAINHMNRGFLVGIFPEGERTRGKMVRFNRGFLSLVRRTDLPVYPVGIVGTGKLMPVGSAWIRPGKVTVVYGHPLTDEEREQLRTGTNDHELAEMMRQRVADCMAEAGH